MCGLHALENCADVAAVAEAFVPSTLAAEGVKAPHLCAVVCISVTTKGKIVLYIRLMPVCL